MKNSTFSVILLLLCITAKGTAQEFLSQRKPIQLIDWNFKKGYWGQAKQLDFSENDWKKIQVPHTYSMDAIQKTGYYQGQAWYRKSITLAATAKNKKTFIRFEGVGQDAELFINEKSVGKHSGSYSAFCFDITDYIKVGANLFSLKVSNISNHKTIPIVDNLFNNYGGIYRPVVLFTTPNTHISTTHYGSSGIFIDAENDTASNKATVIVKTHIKNSTAKSQLSYEIKNASGKTIATHKTKLTKASDKDHIEQQEFTIENPILWNGKANPHQYHLKVTLTSNGKTDIVTEKFGIRSFKVDPEKGFSLNGAAYKLNGVCRHQEWEKEGPALTDAHHKTDMTIINEMGATAIRLAHYQQAETMYNIADEMGMVVWAEIPFVHDWSGNESENAKQQLKELILQNYNHPSICFWGLWNEVRAWSKKVEPCVTLTQELNELAHQLDPKRYTTSASDRPYEAPMNNISDLQSWNKYYGWYYGNYEDMGPWLDKTHKEHPNTSIGISEYGIGGNVNHQEQSKLEKPGGRFFPEQEQTHYHEVSWAQLKNRDFIWSTFIWNMFDFSVNGWNRGGIANLNHKGLVSFDRKIKKDAFFFYKANWSNNPVVHIVESRNTDRKEKITTIKVYSNQEQVELYINGAKVGSQKPNPDSKIILFTNAMLEKGSNQIDAIGISGDQKLTHHADWIYTKN